MTPLSIFSTYKVHTKLFIYYLFISDFAMSNEIKDEDKVHSDEVHRENEQTQEIDQENQPSPLKIPSENEQSEEIDQPPPPPQPLEIPSENEQSEEIDQENQPPASLEVPSENEQSEEITKETSVENKEEIELPNDYESPSVASFSDVIIEKEEDPSPSPVSEENSSALPPSEEIKTLLDTVPSESLTRSDDTHELLQIIADKSNKEASSTILNTVSQ
jgi:hypothetical protein